MTLPARSILFVPGDRAERFEKATASGADLVVIDLEDAVQPERKAAARDTIHDALSTPGGARFVVRVNALGTPWHEDDVRAMSSLPGLAGLMLPKAEAAEDFGAMRAADVPLHGLIETARGLLNLAALCTAQGLVRLSFGTVDFQVDASINGDREELDAARMMLVLHSKASGLQAPVDGVFINLTDEAGLADDARRSRRFGFGGKLCVHPRQVAVVNAAFAPDPAEVDWARRVMAALSSGGHGAVAVDGKLIDKPIVDRARLMLAASAAYTAPV